MPFEAQYICIWTPQVFEGPYHEWFNANRRWAREGGGVEYNYLEESLAAVADAVKRRGPYDGFIGFSQGGTLAHLCAMLACEGQLPFEPPQFLIMICSRASRHYAHQELRERAQLRLPALVIYNGEDEKVGPEETMRLIETFAYPVGQVHPNPNPSPNHNQNQNHNHNHNHNPNPSLSPKTLTLTLTLTN